MTNYLIAGLGNIGPEYELTRHNIGFLTLDWLADEYKTSFESERYAERATVRYKGRTMHLIKPSTYMNLSGNAVHYWMTKLRIAKEQLLVVVDDVALPFGKLRMRARGSSAGHNGLNNIEETLGDDAYPRLRIGIGSEFRRGAQIDYVLGRFSDEEFKELPDIFKKATDIVLSFCTQGIDRTMNQYND